MGYIELGDLLSEVSKGGIYFIDHKKYQNRFMFPGFQKHVGGWSNGVKDIYISSTAAEELGFDFLSSNGFTYKTKGSGDFNFWLSRYDNVKGLEAVLKEFARLNGKSLERRPSLDPSYADELNNLARPSRYEGQKFKSSPEDRKLIELRAMAVAEQSLIAMGFTVKDVSSNSSYDFLISKGGEEYKIEVKGTTAKSCDAILMTKNEVRLHQKAKGKTGLVIVTGINLITKNDEKCASDGILELYLDWDIDTWEIEPLAFQVSKPLPK